jgi:Flp pilus assembly protein TadG
VINRVRRYSVRRSVDNRRRSQRGQGLVEFALIVPLMFLLAVAVGDFGRLFTAAVAVESAAREAADYGAFLGKDRWDEADAATMATNEAEMRRRACTSSAELSDYVGSPGADDTDDCTSPAVTIHPPIHPSSGPAAAGSCTAAGPLDKPCWIHVTVTYEFRPLIPFPPIPSSITITRDSWFAISDLTGN